MNITLAQNQDKIPALTGWRTIAAGLVFFYHWFFQYVDALPFGIAAPFKVGYVGVPIFFALSGFLITWRYLEAFGTGKITYWQYLYKRIVRIFPLYLFVVTLFVAAFGRPTGMIPPSWAGWTAVYTLTQAFFPDWLLMGTAVGWTLTIELLFYLVAPGLLRLFYGQSVGRVLGICVGATLLLGLMGVGLSGMTAVPNSLLGMDRDWLFHYTLFGHAPDFLIGMFCAILYLKRHDLPALTRYVSALVWGSLLLGYGAIFWLAASEAALGSFQNRGLAFGVALASALLILGCALDSERRHPVTRLLSGRVIVYLGAVSYAFYLIQLTEPIQWLYWLGLGVHTGVENRLWQGVLLYFLTTAVAVLCYELVEKPLHRWLSRPWGRRHT